MSKTDGTWTKEYGTDNYGRPTIVVTKNVEKPYVAPHNRLQIFLMKIVLGLAGILFLLMAGCAAIM